MSAQPVPPRPSSLRASAGRTIAKIALLITAFAIPVMIFEGVLRLVFPVPENPSANLSYAQNLPGLSTHVTYTENAFGFRSAAMTSEEKPVDTVRVLVLGASTTQQTTQALEDTWSNLLATQLNERFSDSGFQIEIGAFGRGGLRATHLNRWARTHLARFDPDIVVTLLGINDLAFGGATIDPVLEEPSQDFFVPSKETNSEEAPPKRSLKERCIAASQVCRRLNTVTERARNAINTLRGSAVEWHSSQLPDLRKTLAELPLEEPPKHQTDPIEQFETAMEALLRVIRRTGADPVVLGQPVLWRASLSPEEIGRLWFPVETADGPVRASPGWLAAEMKRYNELQARLAQKHGAVYIELDEHIEKSTQNYFDDCHYTDLGSSRLAAVVLPQLAAVVRQRIETTRQGGPRLSWAAGAGLAP